MEHDLRLSGRPPGLSALSVTAAVRTQAERLPGKRRPLAWLLPTIIGVVLLVLVLVPIAFMFVGSVLSGGLADPATHFTLDKLAQVYATLSSAGEVLSTLIVSALVAVLAMVAGVILAWLTSRTDLPGRGFMEGCVIAPLFLSPFVGAIAWLILGSPKAGMLNVLATELTGIRGPIINVATPTGIVLIMALYFVPYAYLTISAALRNIDPSLEEASYLNGSGVLATALRVTLPVVRPSLISAFFFIFVLAAGTFAIPAVLDLSSQLRFLAVDVYQSSATYPIDYGQSAAIGTVLFWISLLGIACYRFASRAARRFVTVTARGFRIRTLPLRGWRYPAIALVLCYLLLAIVLPYLALLYAAFTRYTAASVLNATFSLSNFAAVTSSPEVVASTRNTLLVGVIAPTLCVLLGAVIAYAVRRLRVAFSTVIDYVAMFPLAIPGIVLGTGIFWTYVLTPVYGTIWVLVLAFITSYLPFAYRMSDTALLQIDRSLEEASALCGASHWRTATRITMRLIQPALLSAWIMVFVFSVREISAAILLTSSDNVVLSVLSWNYLDYGDVQKAAVVGLLQTVILVAGVAIGRSVFRVKLTRTV
jgi:iron(III) transport system permease protein